MAYLAIAAVFAAFYLGITLGSRARPMRHETVLSIVIVTAAVAALPYILAAPALVQVLGSVAASFGFAFALAGRSPKKYRFNGR